MVCFSVTHNNVVFILNFQVYALGYYDRQNSIREQQLRDFYYAAYDYDAQYVAYQAQQQPMSLYGEILEPELSVAGAHMVKDPNDPYRKYFQQFLQNFVPSAEAQAFNQGTKLAFTEKNW